MSEPELDALLAEQVAYYRARAPEYDSTVAIDEASRQALVHAIRAFQPRGRVLELACGTGQWTQQLARDATELMAVDSAPEMLAIARRRITDQRVRFVSADIFDWSPDARYDVVFFCAWLSHVPPQRFDEFWAFADRCLNETGRVFMIDELPAVADGECAVPGAVAPAVRRPLRDGRSYRAVKVFYEPEALRERLAGLGWEFEVHPVDWQLFYATGRRASQ